MKSLLAKIMLCSLICLLLGSASGLLTIDAITGWYASIEKPSWNPPNWIFGPVWTTLYVMMGSAIALIWHSDHPDKKRAMYLFVLQFLLNLMWTPLFFGLQWIGAAFFDILLLFVLIILTIMKFAKISKGAAWLLVPYLAWVGFASALNGTIWHLNSNPSAKTTTTLFDENTMTDPKEPISWKKIMEYSKKGNPPPDRRVVKTEAEWKKILTDEQFYVMRQSGTERPFSSEMCSRFEPGIYACAGCNTPMFDGTTKFDSGTGWPSFTQPLKHNVVSYLLDESYGMVRIEARCSTCDAHLGHVFPDGPKPTGLRYCMNALSLKRIE
jgi:peptide-methionine (R)-S-oxide reductase